ncbi:hypothetical protein NQ315_011954 [Exocentrus adspersus]|uniref:Biogenesis of lysosome-related organelles complex 1 subunit 6 n=1 Tax=Exocentrus adspersus TaxID=1586481 RepID=A0AAV8W0X7_9CUCU|nr:hypothetical protein NQ315_011954 [Exocentrus adspersus]
MNNTMTTSGVNENVGSTKELPVETANSGDAISNPYSHSVPKLSKGLVSLYSSPLEETEKHLKELTAKQKFVEAQISEEFLKISEVVQSTELQSTAVKLKTYNEKLLTLQKDMKSIYERSTKLKKRALRLQQVKRTEEQNKVQTDKKGGCVKSDRFTKLGYLRIIMKKISKV